MWAGNYKSKLPALLLAKESCGCFFGLKTEVKTNQANFQVRGQFLNK
jgi:hypothetical protein